jgi:hypothetical protein
MLLTADHGTIVTEWRQRVRTGWGAGPHWHTIDGTAALVRTLLDGRAEPAVAMSELGRRCGMDGHGLDDVTAWMDELLDVAPRRLRRHLDRSEAAVALTAGWAEGTLERRHSELDDLVPVAALELAVRQKYEQCETMALPITSSYALAVIVAETDGLPWRARVTAVNALATRVRRAFCNGETMAATPTGRILVLVERTPELAAVVRAVTLECEASPLLAGCTRVRGWVEPLAPDPQHLSSHLAELAK